MWYSYLNDSKNLQVECVQWYPADAGLFSTSSRDKRVKIWDPNHMKVVDQFDIDCHIHHHQMSPVATKHSLLAVAGDSGKFVIVFSLQECWMHDFLSSLSVNAPAYNAKNYCQFHIDHHSKKWRYSIFSEGIKWKEGI